MVEQPWKAAGQTENSTVFSAPPAMFLCSYPQDPKGHSLSMDMHISHVPNG